MRRVFVVQCGRGLIENQKFYSLRECLGDFYKLLLADADLFDLCVRALAKANTGDKFLCLLTGLIPVDQAETLDFVVQKNVLCD